MAKKSKLVIISAQLDEAIELLAEEQDRSRELQARVNVLEKLLEEERRNFSTLIAEKDKRIKYRRIDPTNQESAIEKKKLITIIENLSTALSNNI